MKIGGREVLLPPPTGEEFAALEVRVADLETRMTAVETALLGAGMAVDPAVQEMLDRAKLAGEKYR